jgi:hypothetical protein
VQALAPWIERFESTTGLPRHVLAAVAILLLGWLASKISRALAVRLIRRIQAWWYPPARRAAGDVSVGAEGTDAVIPQMVFWLGLLLTAMAATEALGLPVVTTWLGRVAGWAPRVIAAALIAIVGVVAGQVVRGAIARAVSDTPLVRADRLARIAQVGVVLTAWLVAAQQVGIEITLLTTSLLIALGALLGGAALAFGVGGGVIVANILSGHYVRKIYLVGQVVRIAGIQGRILRFTPAAVIVGTDEGEVAVPCRRFVDEASVLVAREG